MKLLFGIVFSIVIHLVFSVESEKNSNEKYLSKKEAKFLNTDLTKIEMMNKVENEEKLKNNKLKSEIPIKKNFIQHENIPKILSEEEVI